MSLVKRALGAAAGVGRRLRPGGGESTEQRYAAEPDGRPNTPDRPAHVTPPPTAGGDAGSARNAG